MTAIEAYDSPDGLARFYFSHSDDKFTTGVMVLKPGAALPKHSRPKAVENLVQVSGKCLMQVFEGEEAKDIVLEPNASLQIPLGVYHIHSNPFEAESLTFFKAEGDITEIMDELRDSFAEINL